MSLFRRHSQEDRDQVDRDLKVIKARQQELHERLDAIRRQMELEVPKRVSLGDALATDAESATWGTDEP